METKRHAIKNLSLTGVAASCALLAACSGGTTGTGSPRGSLLEENGVAVQASLPGSLPPAPPVTGIELLGPVDAKTVAAAWRDGVARFENGDYQGAVSHLQVTVRGRTNDAYAHYLLGLAQWKSGELEQAARSLETSLTLDATRPRCWVNLARVRMDLGDASGALEAATKCLEIDPGSSDGYHLEGRAEAALGRADEAEASLGKACELDPGSGYAQNSLGLLLIQRGRFGDAVPHLEAAKSKLPQVSFVRNNLGVAYERTGRLKEAAIEYQAAVDAGDTHTALKSLARLGPLVPADAPAVAEKE